MSTATGYTLTDGQGGIIRTTASPIGERELGGLPQFDSRRALMGATVNWDVEPTQRMRGDDYFYPGYMRDGRPVMISKTLKFYFDCQL